MQTTGNEHFDPMPLQRLHRLANDPQVIRQVTQVFCADAQNQLADIKRLCAERHYPPLARAAHKLKGACLIVGLSGCAQRCELLEQTALAQGDVETLYSQLRQQFPLGLKMLELAVTEITLNDRPSR